jgi:small subunit ribosomal protein S21
MAVLLMAFPVTAEPTHATCLDPVPECGHGKQKASFHSGDASTSWKELILKVFVRDNNVEQALRVLKKKLQRDGLFREIKRRKAYEKPSQRKAREKQEAIRRGRKAARKLAQREGLASPRIGRATFGRRSA